MKKRSFLITLVFSLIGATIATVINHSNNEKFKEELNQSIENSNYSIEVSNYDRVIVLESKPTSVLTLGPNCTEMFAMLGLEELVIGRSLVNHSRGPLVEYEEAVNSIPILNNAEATREAILTSGADFIYAIDWEISDVGCNIDEVREYGINVYVNSASTIEEQYKEIADIGKIFGVEDRASELIEEQKVRISKVSEKVKNDEKVKVLVYDSGGDGVFTATGINFESRLIEEAGGVNIFSDITDKDWTTVSYEDIIARNPDVIIIHDYNNVSYEDKIAEIKANPALSTLDCVKNDNFSIIPLESVLAGGRMANTVEQLARDFSK